MLRIRRALVVLGALATLAAGGCSDEDGAVRNGPQTEEQRELAAEYAKECDWMVQRGSVNSDLVRESFVAGPAAAEGARLYLETDQVEAGDRFAVAVGNDSSETIDYGTANHIEDSSGNVVEPEGNQLFLLIGLSAPPGEVGPCITASVPSGLEPGTYAVVVEADAGEGPPEDLKASFEVSQPE